MLLLLEAFRCCIFFPPLLLVCVCTGLVFAFANHFCMLNFLTWIRSVVMWNVCIHIFGISKLTWFLGFIHVYLRGLSTDWRNRLSWSWSWFWYISSCCAIYHFVNTHSASIKSICKRTNDSIYCSVQFFPSPLHSLFFTIRSVCVKISLFFKQSFLCLPKFISDGKWIQIKITDELFLIPLHTKKKVETCAHKNR